MITPSYCQLMARYGRWMNERMFAACVSIPDEDRRLDRGAHFGSLHRSLNHILWGDRTWLGRFVQKPFGEPPYGADMLKDFEALRVARHAADEDIAAWASTVTPAWLESTLEYRRAA